ILNLKLFCRAVKTRWPKKTPTRSTTRLNLRDREKQKDKNHPMPPAEARGHILRQVKHDNHYRRQDRPGYDSPCKSTRRQISISFYRKRQKKHRCLIRKIRNRHCDGRQGETHNHSPLFERTHPLPPQPVDDQGKTSDKRGK